MPNTPQPTGKDVYVLFSGSGDDAQVAGVVSSEDAAMEWMDRNNAERSYVSFPLDQIDGLDFYN